MASGEWFESFDDFVVQRQATLTRSAWAILLSWDDAQEAVAEVLIMVFRNWKSIRMKDSPDSFIQRSLTNKCIDFKRRAWSRREVLHQPEQMPELASGDPGDELDRRDQIARCLQTLSRQQRALVFKYYFEDKGFGQISAEMGIRESTARKYLSEAHARLESLLRATS